MKPEWHQACSLSAGSVVLKIVKTIGTVVFFVSLTQTQLIYADCGGIQTGTDLVSPALVTQTAAITGQIPMELPKDVTQDQIDLLTERV